MCSWITNNNFGWGRKLNFYLVFFVDPNDFRTLFIVRETRPDCSIFDVFFFFSHLSFARCSNKNERYWLRSTKEAVEYIHLNLTKENKKLFTFHIGDFRNMLKCHVRQFFIFFFAFSFSILPPMSIKFGRLAYYKNFTHPTASNIIHLMQYNFHPQNIPFLFISYAIISIAKIPKLNYYIWRPFSWYYYQNDTFIFFLSRLPIFWYGTNDIE